MRSVLVLTVLAGTAHAKPKSSPAPEQDRASVPLCVAIDAYRTAVKENRSNYHPKFPGSTTCGSEDAVDSGIVLSCSFPRAMKDTLIRDLRACFGAERTQALTFHDGRSHTKYTSLDWVTGGARLTGTSKLLSLQLGEPCGRKKSGCVTWTKPVKRRR